MLRRSESQILPTPELNIDLTVALETLAALLNTSVIPYVRTSRRRDMLCDVIRGLQATQHSSGVCFSSLACHVKYCVRGIPVRIMTIMDARDVPVDMDRVIAELNRMAPQLTGDLQACCVPNILHEMLSTVEKTGVLLVTLAGRGWKVEYAEVTEDNADSFMRLLTTTSGD